MSKRKGRRPPINSEIKSVMRAPEELSETAGTEDAPPRGEDVPPSGEAVTSPDPEPDPIQTAESSAADNAPVETADGFNVMEGVEEAIEDHELPQLVPDNLELGEADDTESFLSGLLEALLFTSQRPLALKELARAAGIDRPRAKELLDRVIQSRAKTGVCIEEVAGGFIMRSSPRYAPHIQKLLALRPIRLSRAQLETLAIIAYRQPVTKPEVDVIRGVDTGQVIKGLLERNLLKILGKKDEPGRPMLYGTTTEFLELLSLTSLKDLPTLREYTELSEESRRKFSDATGEAAPSDSVPPASEPPPADETQPDDAVRAADGDAEAETLDLADILEASMSSEGPELPRDVAESDADAEGDARTESEGESSEARAIESLADEEAVADEEASPAVVHSTSEEQYSDGSESSTSNA